MPFESDVRLWVVFNFSPNLKLSRCLYRAGGAYKKSVLNSYKAYLKSVHANTTNSSNAWQKNWYTDKFSFNLCTPQGFQLNDGCIYSVMMSTRTELWSFLHEHFVYFCVTECTLIDFVGWGAHYNLCKIYCLFRKCYEKLSWLLVKNSENFSKWECKLKA